MTMTYAAQVRSMSKSIMKQTSQDDPYDINSLRIFCQYFVGSNVIIKTVDEMLEGILHTILNNTICLTQVTITKPDNPDKITKVLASKTVSLNDVLYLNSKDSGNVDVTVKGKDVKNIKEINNNNCNNAQANVCDQNILLKSLTSLCQKTEDSNSADVIDNVVISNVNSDKTGESIVDRGDKVEKKDDTTQSEEIVNGMIQMSAFEGTIEENKDVLENKIHEENVIGDRLQREVVDNLVEKLVVNDEITALTESVDDVTNSLMDVTETKSDISQSKKSLILNPHAPEFKPRSVPTYSDSAVPEQVMFSPQPHSFPQVFTPNSAPAIFVPNLFFYAPNPMNTVDGHGIETASVRPPPTRIHDFHVPNHPIPFPSVLPIFPHQLPIFIPNHTPPQVRTPVPYRLRHRHTRTSDSSNNTEPCPATDSIDNELSNPSHWPPLPNPGQGATPPASVTTTLVTSDCAASLKKPSLP